MQPAGILQRLPRPMALLAPQLAQQLPDDWLVGVVQLQLLSLAADVSVWVPLLQRPGLSQEQPPPPPWHRIYPLLESP